MSRRRRPHRSASGLTIQVPIARPALCTTNTQVMSAGATPKACATGAKTKPMTKTSYLSIIMMPAHNVITRICTPPMRCWLMKSPTSKSRPCIVASHSLDCDMEPCRSPHDHQRVDCNDSVPVRIDNQRIDIDLGYLGMRSDQSVETAGRLRHGVQVERRRAAHATQYGGAFESLHGGDYRIGIEAGRQQAHVAQRLGPDAAEADDQHESPIRIAPGAQHELHAVPHHCLDHNSVERHIRPRLGDVRVELVPRPGERGLVAQSERYTPDVALVGKRG